MFYMVSDADDLWGLWGKIVNDWDSFIKRKASFVKVSQKKLKQYLKPVKDHNHVTHFSKAWQQLCVSKTKSKMSLITFQGKNNAVSASLSLSILHHSYK